MSSSTYPPKWTGEIYLNMSPSDPVNALLRSEVVYDGGDWPVDYVIDMPEGVSDDRRFLMRSTR